jgi:hypothetical protein
VVRFPWPTDAMAPRLGEAAWQLSAGASEAARRGARLWGSRAGARVLASADETGAARPIAPAHARRTRTVRTRGRRKRNNAG